MKNLVVFFLIPFLGFCQTQIGSDINGEVAGERSGNSISLSSDGTILAVGAELNDQNGLNSGAVRVYKNTSGTWTQLGTTIYGESVGDLSGSSVSLSSNGSILAIGAHLNDGNGQNSGHVRVFRNNLGVWTQIGNDIDGTVAGDQCGNSNSLSSNGSIIAIGSWLNNGNGYKKGNVRVFQNISEAWIQIGTDINGEADEDFSGLYISLSSDGTTLAIGSQRNDGNGIDSGHVRVYHITSGTWTQIGNDIDGEAAGDRSGIKFSISSDGSTIAIGSILNDGNGIDSGHVRVFQNISSVWTQIGNDINGEVAGDHFGNGISLSLDNNILIVGADLNDGNGIDSGHVRVFRYVSGTWIQVGIDINGEGADDKSGVSNSLSSNATILAIGSSFNDGNGIDSGHVRLFDITNFLSSNEFVLENFTITPNPTSQLININLNDSLEFQKATIYNTLGQIIKTETTKNISVSDLSNGTYFIEVETNKGKATKTFIKE